MGPPVGCNAASVIQYSGETGNREWPIDWRERERESKEKKTFFCGYAKFRNLEMDQKQVAGSPAVNWIWEFNNKKMGDHCLITCFMQLLSCLFLFFQARYEF